MKVLTFLTFVWAGLVVFTEYRGKTSGPSAITNNVSRPVASAGGTPFRPAAAQPSASTTVSSIIPPSSPSDVLSSAMDFVKQKLSTVSIGPSFTSSPLSLKSSSRAELRIARGVVVGQDGSDLVLNCSGWIVQSIHGYVYAGDGAGMDPMAANLVDAHEQFRFGRLLAVNQGTLLESFTIYDKAMWSTGSYLSGPVLVKGYPGGPVNKGKGMKIVVAPDGTGSWMGNSIPAYTASFTLSD